MTNRFQSDGTVNFSNGEIPDADDFNDTLVAGAPPIGSVQPWLKNLTGTPALSGYWVECNGQTLSDAESPYNGQVIPDLNGDNRFLRGGATSGATGGSDTHTHTGTTGGPLGGDNSYDIGPGEYDNHVHTFTTDATDAKPPYYEVVWIMRIK